MDNLGAVKDLIKIIIKNLKDILKERYQEVSTFAKNQLQMTSNQAVWIASERAMGSLKNNDELYDFFVTSLKTSATNFARSMVQMTLLTLEEAWNAIIEATWNFLNGLLTQAGLARLAVPEMDR